MFQWNGIWDGMVEISHRYVNVFENGSNKLCACAHLSCAIELLNLIKKIPRFMLAQMLKEKKTSEYKFCEWK